MVELQYGRMMQRAMLGLVADALRTVAEHGMPGEHHFYIQFRTDHPGVDMPDWLRAKHPEEMMIVLQHEFWDLAVAGDRFSVGLSFSDTPCALVVPFDAVLQFADPTAEFGLRFDPSENEDEDGAVFRRNAGRAPVRDHVRGLRESDRDADAADRGDGAPDGGDGAPRAPADVVDLASFRKK